MAESSLLCPHCEQRVEIQVAAVTRSRVCPACGATLVLQVAEKGGAVKRKALLIAPTPPVEDTREEPLTNSFQGLPEDPFERMRLDPSLAKVRRGFFMGVAAVIGLIVVAIWVDYHRQSQPVEVAAPKRPPTAAEVEPAKIQHVQPAFAMVTLEERLGQLQGNTELPHKERQREEEKLAAPVFEVTEGNPLEKRADSGAPKVFEVSDLPAVAAPRP